MSSFVFFNFDLCFFLEHDFSHAAKRFQKEFGLRSGHTPLRLLTIERLLGGCGANTVEDSQSFVWKFQRCSPEILAQMLDR
jgi:hypothetical protein